MVTWMVLQVFQKRGKLMVLVLKEIFILFVGIVSGLKIACIIRAERDGRE